MKVCLEVIFYLSFQTFQLRAHIFQGRFDPGMDASGLLDPFVRIIFHGYTLVTKVSLFGIIFFFFLHFFPTKFLPK